MQLLQVFVTFFLMLGFDDGREIKLRPRQNQEPEENEVNEDKREPGVGKRAKITTWDIKYEICIPCKLIMS